MDAAAEARSIEFAPLYKLLAGVPIDTLRVEWERLANVDRANPGLTSADWVGILKAHSPDAKDDVELAQRILGLFKQMDARGDGRLSWDDFTSFVMTMTMDMGEDAGDTSSLQVAPRGAGAGGGGGGGSLAPPAPPASSATSEVKRVFQPLHLSLSDEFPGGVRRVAFLDEPVGRALVLQHGSECVHMIAPLVKLGEAPRLAGVFRHHTAYRPHEVGACASSF